MYGYSRDEAMGQVSADLLKTRYPGSHASAYAMVMESRLWQGRLVQTRKDGAEIVVEGKWVLDPAGERILEVNREITDELVSAERFQVLVESVKDYAIFLLDTDGHIRTWNEGARRIKGYENDEIIGAHLSVFYPPEEVDTGKPDRELAIARETGRVE